MDGYMLRKLSSRQRQYSLSASPPMAKKSRVKGRNTTVSEDKPAPLLVHTIKVPSISESADAIETKPVGGKAVGRRKLHSTTAIKRKNEIRDVLRANNKDYADNFFDSTPVRNRKPSRYPVTDVLVEDPSVIETDSRLCQQHVFPSLAEINTSHVNTHQIFSSPPTLSNTVKRKNADVIVLRMQKLRRCRRHVTRATASSNSDGENSVVKKTTCNLISGAGVFRNTVKVDDGNLSSDNDEYFSDTED
ncbi:uncharacterized protein [Dysidea avara]|uniref:uncharacterized protein isoform X2 n=1 Tax=Dysidea avara TaxID=196820 RepID=UPI00331C4D78